MSVRGLILVSLALLLLPGSEAAAQASGSVAGVVSDETGAPLAGAAVSVGGRGVLTGADGRYVVAGLPPGAHRVRAVLIGFGAEERLVTVTEAEAVRADFQLAAEPLALEGIVAVGYGTQRRRDLTGSVSSIDVDAVQSAPLTSVDQALQGQAPGVQVTRNSGAPGGGVSIRIRGSNSITASGEPLYVIDGVPAFVGSQAGASSRTGDALNPLADINPNDIESVEILKDASATAIYGSRGANGVILITTRRGTPGGDGMQISSSYGMQEVTRTIPLLNARQYAELSNEAYINGGLEPLFTQAQVESFDDGTDWQEEIFRTAPVQDHSITVSGGDERTRYLVSAGFFDQQGVIENSSFRRYSARLNLDREVNNRARIGNSLTLSRSEGNVSVAGGNLRAASTVMGALWSSPTQPVRDENGDYVRNSSPFYPYPNPVATATEITNDRFASRIVGNVFGEYDLSDGLRFRTSLGGNFVYQQGDYYAPTYIVQGEDVGGDASRSSAQESTVLNENLLSYQRGLRGDVDRLDLTGGFTMQTFRGESVSAQSQQFATDVTGSNSLGAGAVPLNPSSGTNEWTLLSYLGRMNYSLADKYLFTLTGRYDGSSKFGADSKWGFFPSGAFAWRVSSEPFLQRVDWISDLKLRASYGKTGNQEIGTYASLARLSVSEYEIGGSLRKGYSPAGRAANPDLHWETTTQFDVGADVVLFDQRLTLIADYYRSVTDDLLLAVTLPATTGYSEQLQNVGSVRNSGLELGISTQNVRRENFTWRTTLNVSGNRNTVIELGDGEEIIAGVAGVSGQIGGGGTSIIRTGEPLGSFYGYQTEGIWQTGDDVESSGDAAAAPGEYRFADVNGDGEINSEDRTILGYAQPDFFGGLTNNVSLGPVALDVLVTGTFGGQILNTAAAQIRSVTGRSNETVESLQRWTPSNPSTTIPRANVERPRTLLDVYVEDGTFVRLQNITLSYQLPTRPLSAVQRARLYVSGQDLWTWTDYTGYDPEVNTISDEPGARGVDLGGYPRARTVNLGIELGF